MIRFGEKEFQQWSICPATGDIFDAETGEVQIVKMHQGRPRFRGMAVHQIMVNTFYGFKPRFDVHHLDENKLNNALSNLVYLTRSEHARLHNIGKKREPFSEEHKAKISSTMKGKPLSTETREKISATMKGKPRSAETRAKISAARRRNRAGNISTNLS